MPMTKPTSEQVTFLAAGSGASQRTVLDRLRDVVSVKDFGAVGDGVTDDTVAIRAAISACGTSGQALYFPTGTYIVNNQTGDTTSGTLGILYVNKAIRMFGDGQSRTRIQIGTVGTAFGLMYMDVTGGTAWPGMLIGPGNFDMSLSDMTLDANGADKWALYVRGQYTHVQNVALVRASGTGGYGLRLEGCTLSKISNCSAYYNFNGIGIANSINTFYVRLEDVSVAECVGHHEVDIGPSACVGLVADALYCETDGAAPNHREMLKLNGVSAAMFTNFSAETYNGNGRAEWVTPYTFLILLQNCYDVTFDGGYVSHAGLPAVGSDVTGVFVNTPSHNVTIRNMLFNGQTAGPWLAPTGFTCIAADTNVRNLTIDNIVTQFTNALVGVSRPNGTNGENLTIQSFRTRSGFSAPTFVVDTAVAGTTDGLNRLSVTQLVFPATPTPSAASTVLDAYQESTFAPTFEASGGGMSVSYHADTFARATKIGNQVYCHGRIRLSAVTAAGTGHVRLANLPYSSKAGTANDVTGTVTIGQAANFTTDYPTSGIVPVSSTYATLYETSGSADSATIPVAALSATTNMAFSIQYTSLD